jgi:hypothetical protein
MDDDCDSYIYNCKCLDTFYHIKNVSSQNLELQSVVVWGGKFHMFLAYVCITFKIIQNKKNCIIVFPIYYNVHSLWGIDKISGE